MLIGSNNSTCKFNGVPVDSAATLYARYKADESGSVEWNGKEWASIARRSTSLLSRRLRVVWVIDENGAEYQHDADESVAYSVPLVSPCYAWKKIKIWYELKDFDEV